MNFRWTSITLALTAVVLIVASCAGTAARAASITILNTSSSYYQIRDESAGNSIVVDDHNREATNTYTLPNSHNFRLYIGTVGDQGNHYFKTDASGNVFADPTNPFSSFFTTPTSTSITAGSIPVYIRQLSGNLPEQMMGGGSPPSDTYFASPIISAYGAAGQVTVNLVPDDRAGTPFNTGFRGNWKNIFPYSFVQQTPMQLGPLTDTSGNQYGITSMTNVDSPTQTTIVSATLVKFFEGTHHYRGWDVIVDRADGNQAGDGSEFLFFTEIPEPGAAGLVALVGSIALARRRRK